MRRLYVLALGIGLVAQVAALPVAGQSPSTGLPIEGSVVIVQLRAPDGGALTEEQRNDTEAVISARLQALPDARLLMSTIPDDRLRFDLDDPAQAGVIRYVVTAPGVLTFVPMPDELADQVEDGRPLPDGIGSGPLLASDSIESVAISTGAIDPPTVDIRLTPTAADVFDAWAATHQGQRLAIVLDDVVVSAPVIQSSRFDGALQVSMDPQAGSELAAIVSGGVLPVVAEAIAVCPERDPCPLPTPSASPPQVSPPAP